MSGLDSLVEIGTLGLVDDFSGAQAAQDAANTQAGYNAQAQAQLQAQYDQTRTDLLPFLQAATGGRAQYDQYNQQLNDIANDFLIKEKDAIAQWSPNGLQNTDQVIAAMLGGDMGQGWNERWGSKFGEVRELTDKINAMGDPANFKPGALQQYQEGLEVAPLPPELQGFQFDVSKAMDSPELAFQREFGEQQIDRLAGKNKQLGSGNRLYDVMRFGQGLASQSLGDQYNRELSTYGTNQNTSLKNYGLISDRYNTRMNRLGGLIDVGRGTGTALGASGATAGQGIAGLLSDTGSGYAAAGLVPSQFQGQLIGAAATGLGYSLGGPAGAAIAGAVTGGGGGINIGFDPSGEDFF